MRKLSQRRTVAAAAVFILGAALETRAEDKPAPAANAESPVQPGAIAAAKKDFEAVKTGRDAALQRPVDLPRMSVPEWQGSSPTLNLNVQPKTPARETKSATWLVDAMEKLPGTREPRTPTDRDRRRGLAASVRDDETEASGRHDLRRLEETNEKNEPRRVDATEIINPLARHLGDWMTPGDYALLKPGLAQSLGSAPSAKGTTAFGGIGSPASILPVPGSEAMLGLMAPVQPTFTPTAPRENPYLQSLAFPESAVTPLPAKPKTEMPAPARAQGIPSFSPPAPVPPPSSKVPEFARPPTDEKFFKPLKRF